MKFYRPKIPRMVRYGWMSWRHELTPPGKYVVACMFLACFGTASVQIPVYQLLCALAALLLVAASIGVAVRPRALVVGRFPEKGTAGQALSAQFTVINNLRFPAYDVSAGFFDLPTTIHQEEADQIVPTLSGRASVTIPVVIRPERRGLYALPDLRIYSTFPFGLGRFGQSRHSLPPLLVQPAFHPLSGISIPISTRYQPGGISLTSNVGESPEYIGNREYIPGEPVRRLDFRSWARLGRPVVREYQEEYYCRIALILDTYVAPGRKATVNGFPELEAAVSLAASVADALSDGEYLLDIFAAGPELYVFRSGRHTAHFDNVLEILACVDACRINPFETVGPALDDELGNISAAICVFLDWDSSRRELARTVLEAGCSLKVLIVRDGDTTEPCDGLDAGELQQFGSAQVLSGGIDVT